MIQTISENQTRINVPHGSISKDEYGHCRIKFNVGRNELLDLVAADQMVEAAYQICNGLPHTFITDGRGAKGTVSASARAHLRSAPRAMAVRKASAIIVDSMANMLIANLYIKLNKPETPTRIFDNEMDALQWLEQFS